MCRVFTILYMKQGLFLGYRVLQQFCTYSLWNMQCHFPCWMFCVFTLAFRDMCVVLKTAVLCISLIFFFTGLLLRYTCFMGRVNVLVVFVRQLYLSDKYLLLYAQSWTPDDGRKYRPKHVECHSKINKSDTLVHLVGFAIGITLVCYWVWYIVLVARRRSSSAETCSCV